MKRSLTSSNVRHERGDVLVSVAFALPVLLLFVALVVDVGNWFEHRRHIQFQSYAAAFAGGSLFQKCISPVAGVTNEANGKIERVARGYAGDPAYVSDPTDPDAPPQAFNKQVGGSNQGAINVLLNSKAYSPGGPADDTVELPACDAKMLDVKMNENGLPIFFSGFLPFLDPVNLHGHARVEIQKVQSQNDVRPLAVRDEPRYKCGSIELVEANAGGVFQTITFQTPPTPAPDGSYVEFKTAPTSVSFPLDNVAVRVHLECGDNADPVTFADPTGGVNFINAYDTGGSQIPAIRKVWLEGGGSGCKPDVYFFTTGCNLIAKAEVEFDPVGIVRSGPNPNAFVWISGEPASWDGGDTWSYPFSVPAQSGPKPYTVRWRQEYGTVNGTPCGDGTGTNPPPCNSEPVEDNLVRQQSFAATDDDTDPSIPNSGDLMLVQIDQDANSGGGANAFPQNVSPTLVFTVHVRTLSNSKPGDDPIVLRFPPSGSKRTGTIVCGPIGGGAGAFEYVITGCPRSVASWTLGSDCATVGNSAPPTPITCVEAIHPGNIVEAIKMRIGDSCNNWNAWEGSLGTPIPMGDPRAMTVIVTPPNSNLSGSAPAGTFWPVRKLGTFYVTGYGLPGGSGSGTGCENESIAGPTQFSVWGHWIKYVVPSSSGTGSTDPFSERLCQFEQFGNCIPVLSR